MFMGHGFHNYKRAAAPAADPGNKTEDLTCEKMEQVETKQWCQPCDGFGTTVCFNIFKFVCKLRNNGQTTKRPL